MVEKQFFKNLFTNLNDYNENNLNCLALKGYLKKSVRNKPLYFNQKIQLIKLL